MYFLLDKKAFSGIMGDFRTPRTPLKALLLGMPFSLKQSGILIVNLLLTA